MESVFVFSPRYSAQELTLPLLPSGTNGEPGLTSLLGTLCLGRNALADSLARSLYSFSISTNFWRSSGPSSPSACNFSTSCSCSVRVLRWVTRAVPNLPASSSLRSVSARCASRARLACLGEDPGPAANSSWSKLENR